LIVAFSWGTPTGQVNVTSLVQVKSVTTPAEAAGLRAGDQIVSINGKTVKDDINFHDMITRLAGTPATFGIERDGHVRHILITPADARGVKKADGGYLALPSYTNPRGYIGVNTKEATTSVSPLGAIKAAGSHVGVYTKGEVLGIAKIFAPSGLSSFYHQVTNSKVAARDSANPGTDNRPVSLIGIASLGVQSQQQGLQSLLELLILINIVFGLMNMLPILPLDGGHVAVAAYEWIRTKKGQPYYRADITKLFPFVAVVLAFLAVIVVAAVYLDITHPLQLP
jgi:membrane-associated protease RseP (regulator of RpoE activity)